MHKERQFKNFDEIIALSNVVRNKDNEIVDELHQTIPFITKYERTRVLGKRVKQLNSGMLPFIEVKREFINNYFIAEEEMRQKKIPLIIERPLPNGAFEYWKVKDLELL
jgi:DNA-directed RNA polymerase subunit K/omega